MIITDNGFVVYYYTGRFDNFCVYVLKPKKRRLQRWTPKDKDYFKWLKLQGKKYGNNEVYNDFITLYKSININTTFKEVVDITRDFNHKYGVKNHHWWVILALTLIAEENKENTILGKRIKLLDVYNLLKDNYPISKIVIYMQGKSWEVFRWST